MKSHNRLFVVGLIGIAFLGCGKSIAPIPVDASASDTAVQSPSQSDQVAVIGVADSGPTATPPTPPSESSSDEVRPRSPNSEPKHEPVKEQNHAQAPPAEQKVKKEVRLDGATDLLEFAQSKGISKQVDARTLIEKAGNSDRVLAGPWKLTISQVTCADGFLEGSPGIRVTDDSEIWLCARIPFRIYISKGPLGESAINTIKGARTVVAAKYEIRSQPYLLAGDSTLRPCSRQEYQAMLISRKTDNLFYSESDRTELLIADQFNPALRAILKDRKPPTGYSMTIYFRDLKYGKSLSHQHSWGFYRSGALRKNDWDSDFLMTWNSTGALTGILPEYFHMDPAKSPMITSATLFAVQVFDPEGNVLANADWELDRK